jgi:hypothetical protein
MKILDVRSRNINFLVFLSSFSIVSADFLPRYLNCRYVVSHSVRVRSLAILSKLNNAATRHTGWQIGEILYVLFWLKIIWRYVGRNMQRLYLTSQLSDCFKVQRSFLIQNSFWETGCIFFFCPTGYRSMNLWVCWQRLKSPAFWDWKLVIQ